MKIETIIFDNDNANSIIVIYEDGTKYPMSYPPADAKSKDMIKDFGGTAEISFATHKYNKDLNERAKRYELFEEGMGKFASNMVIDSIISTTLTNEELMKLKLSMFEHDFVKKSKNKELLTKLRTSKDSLDLIMYFGMLRND